MKNLMKIFVLVTVSLLGAAVFFSCSDQDEVENVPTNVETRALRHVAANTVISQNTTWESDNLYLLWGKVYVTNGATLTIEPGTQIKGKQGIIDPKDASAVIITKGSKIIANGTANEPIIFSSMNGRPGGWGGLVILGDAPINQENPAIEGIDEDVVPEGVDVSFGGNNPMDNSGSLKYVRVEFAGASISQDNELNAFTFGGVGAGTTLEHLQAYYGQDDSFEFFGGTVNAKYLVSTGAKDDCFDFDFGYTGKIQFAVAVVDKNMKHTKDPNGIECDNDGKGSPKTPYTHPTLSNLTIVGSKDGKDIEKPYKSAANFRRNCQFTLVNSVLYGFPKGILKETDNSFTLENNVIASKPAGNEFVSFSADASNVVATAETLKLYSPYGRWYTLALKPVSGSAVDGNYYQHTDSFFVNTNYKGAVAKSGNNWLSASWIKKN